MSSEFPEILTFKQGAEFLQVSKSKLEVLVAQRKVRPSIIPPTKGQRGQRRFKKSYLLKKLDDWAAKGGKPKKGVTG